MLSGFTPLIPKTPAPFSATQFSLENCLLLSITRLDGNAAVASILTEHGHDIDWTVLVAAVIEHELIGIFCKVILEIPSTLVPTEMRLACQQKLSEQKASNSIAAQQLSHILDKLQAADIKAVTFKGPTLAIKAYQDIALRSFRDLDFLIPEAQIEDCLSLLRDMGYHHEHGLSPRQWQAYVHYNGQDILFGPGLPVEPHWAFAQRTLMLDIDYKGFWQRVSDTSFHGQRVLTFSLEDELIILCLHGFKHEWCKLKWVVDLVMFISSHSKIDWAIVMHRAESQGLARIVIFAIALGEYLFGRSVPETVRHWMEKDTFAMLASAKFGGRFFQVAQEAVQRQNKPCSHLHYFRWSMRERYFDRLRYAVRTLTQPRVVHFRTISVPDSLFFFYYPFKISHDYFALPVWLIIKPFKQKLRRLWRAL